MAIAEQRDGDKPRPRRRWWQRLCRLSVLVLVLLSMAYISLPWWVPKEFVRGLIERRLSQQLALPVSVGQADLSWHSGIELDRLTVFSQPAFGSQPMVVIERLEADYSPWALLMNNRLAWMKLTSPQINAQFDRAGNCNLAPLAKPGGKNSLKIGRLSVQQARAIFQFSQQDDALILAISDMQLLGGKMDSLGSVSISGGLVQRDAQAPLNLHLAGGAAEDPAAATASVSFANLDIEQMNLPTMLGLPLSKLRGRCEGSVNFQVSRDLKAPSFTCRIQAHELDVQPLEGPQLPVIDRAGVVISATCDLERIDIQSAKVELPGMELAGHASLALDALRGEWRAIHALDIAGKVYPSALAALLKTPAQRLPAIDGPLAVHVALASSQQRLSLDMDIDAINARITDGQKVLKPSGRALQLKLSAETTYDLHLTQARQCVLKIGDNRFTASGKIHDLGQLIDEMVAGTNVPRAVLRASSNLNLKGNWEIRELQSLQDLLQQRALAAVRCDGAAGEWMIDQKDRPHLLMKLTSQRDGRVVIPGIFAKPPNKPATVLLEAYVNAERAALEDVNLDLAVAQATAGIDNGRVALTSDASGQAAADIAGEFHGDHIEGLLAALPRAAWLSRFCRGTVRGNFKIAAQEQLQTADVFVDLTHANVDCGEFFSKASASPASIDLHLSNQASAATDSPMQVNGAVNLPMAKLAIEACVASESGQPAVTFQTTANIRDSQLLLKSSPALAAMLPDWQAQGPVTVEASGRTIPDGLHVDLQAIADDLELASAAEPKRHKAAGVPMQLSLSTDLTSGFAEGLGTLMARADSISLSLGDTHIGGQARAEFRRRPAILPSLNWNGLQSLAASMSCDVASQYEMRSLSGSVDCHLAFDPSLGELLSEIRLWMQESSVSGEIAAKGSFSGDASKDDGFEIGFEVDASRAAAESLGPFRVKNVDIGPLVKPLDTPTTISGQVVLGRDLRTLKMQSLQAQAGNIQFFAEGQVDLAQTVAGWRPIAKELHASISSDDLHGLWPLMPSLKQYDLSGNAFAELRYRRGNNEEEVASLDLLSKGIDAQAEGKAVHVAGRLSLGEWAFRADQLVQASQLKSDRLDFAIGQNKGTIVADLKDLGDKPSGQVEAICSYIDDEDLSGWVKLVSAKLDRALATSSPASIALKDSGNSPGVTTHPAVLHSRRILPRIKDYLSQADLKARVSVDHLRTYDPAVKQTYDAKHLDARASVNSGEADLKIRAALNGGLYLQQLHTNLRDTAPVVIIDTDIRDVLATANIQPQLSRFFPGNTVYGTFSRSQQVSLSLEDVLANMRDPKYVVHPVGTAVTVTTDGLLEGQAAPKFVTAMFPGLNLARYRYRKMTGFADLRSDGAVYNDMIFDGQTYNTYIDGVTEANNIGQYQIGLILLGSPQTPEYNHKYRLGRLLLLTFRARIEDGKLYNQQVSYPWPDEAFGSLFVRNNSIYQLWRQSKEGK